MNIGESARPRFHEGELEVQRRAGVERMAARVGGMITPAIPPRAGSFLAQQRMVVVAALDGERLRAALLIGDEGFVHATSKDAVQIDDPFVAALPIGTPIALLAIELATRRRMRVNGVVAAGSRVRAEEVFSNCPQYITPREAPPRAHGATSESANLTDEQIAWIENADTFFIATIHPVHGADVSHRGGAPGFVRVRDGALEWPDYEGNMLFQTLGNLAVDPRATLLFVDFLTGATLELSGTAETRWDGERRVVFRPESARTLGA